MARIPNKLSHSAISKYLECGKSYEYYYRQKLRPKALKSSLLFGSAIDSGLEALLSTDKSISQDAHLKFEKTWHVSKNREGKELNIKINSEIEYSSSDLNLNLLTANDVAEVESLKAELSVTLSIEDIVKLKKQEEFKTLSTNVATIYNLICWLSMRQKGFIMLQGFRKEVLPKIKRVLALQKKVEIANEEGDTSIGYIDAVVEWEDGSTVVVDFKTAGRPYDLDAVLTSPQLAAYIFQVENEYKTRKAGFIVLPKTLTKLESKVCQVCGNVATSSHKTCNAMISGKRCNGEWDIALDFKCEPQVLINEMPIRTEELVMENYAVVNKMIKAELFPRNVNACEGKYGRCPYFDVCWNNKLDGMEKPEETK